MSGDAQVLVSQGAHDPLLGERGDESRASATARRRAGPGSPGREGVTTSRPAPSRPWMNRVIKPATCASIAGHPGLLDDPAALSSPRRCWVPGVCPRRNAARRARANSRRCPCGRCPRPRTSPVCVGSEAAPERCRERTETETGRGQQILDGSGRDEIGAERPHVELDRARRLVAVGEARARRSRALLRAMAATSCLCPVRYEIVVQQTSAVRSSIASANRSTGIDPSASGRTCTTSAPRSSCACAICPIVGNSYSLITIRVRPPPRAAAPRRSRSHPARRTW